MVVEVRGLTNLLKSKEKEIILPRASRKKAKMCSFARAASRCASQGKARAPFLNAVNRFLTQRENKKGKRNSRRFVCYLDFSVRDVNPPAG